MTLHGITLTDLKEIKKALSERFSVNKYSRHIHILSDGGCVLKTNIAIAAFAES